MTIRIGTVVALVAVAIIAVVLALRSHDRELAARTEMRTLARQDSAKIAALQKQVAEARTKQVQAEGAVVRAIETYDSARAHGVSTRPVVVAGGAGKPLSGKPGINPGEGAAPGGPGRGSSEIVVTPEFLAAADALRGQCQVLRADCATFRIRADSTISAQASLIEHLQQAGAIPEKRFGITIGPFVGVCVDRRPCGGIGAMIGIRL